MLMPAAVSWWVVLEIAGPLAIGSGVGVLLLEAYLVVKMVEEQLQMALYSPYLYPLSSFYFCCWYS